MIKDIQGKGRGYVATVPLPAGAVVIQENPYCMVTRAPYAEVCCQYCGKLCVAGTVYSLSATDRFRYCSENCISKDYSIHQNELEALRRLLGDAASVQFGDSDPSTLLIRIAAKKKAELAVAGPSECESTEGLGPVVMNGTENRFNQIMNLEAASSRIPEAALTLLKKAAMRLSVICKIGGLSLSNDEALKLYLIQQCNAHQILDNCDNPVALGLFPLTSMLNHSCVPNCAHSFVLEQGCAPLLVMRTLRAVEIGEELVYNYSQLYASTSQRRKSLEQCYSFLCECQRCVAGGDEYIDEYAGESAELIGKLAASTSTLSLKLITDRFTAGTDDAEKIQTQAETLLDDVVCLLLSGKVHCGHVTMVQASALLLRWTQEFSYTGNPNFITEVAALSVLTLVNMWGHCHRGSSMRVRVRVPEATKMITLLKTTIDGLLCENVSIFSVDTKFSIGRKLMTAITLPVDCHELELERVPGMREAIDVLRECLTQQHHVNAHEGNLVEHLRALVAGLEGIFS